MVVSQGLASGGRVGRSLAGGSQVGELSCGLGMLVHDVLSNGAWQKTDQLSGYSAFYSRASNLVLTVSNRVVGSSGV